MHRKSLDRPEPLDAAQFTAAASGIRPEPQELRDGLWCLALPKPGRAPFHTLSVVATSPGDPVMVVDPGWGSDAALHELERFLAGVGRGLEDIGSIVLTHGHHDHIGLAAPLRERSGARVLMHRREQLSIELSRDDVEARERQRLEEWGVPRDLAVHVGQLRAVRAHRSPLRADGFLEDGDRLAAGTSEWTVVPAPGHTPGHICLVDEARNVILTGDHVLPAMYPGIGLGEGSGTNPVAEYLASLDRLEPYGTFDAVPGHGYSFRGLRNRLGSIRRHVLRRAAEVANLVEGEPGGSVFEHASKLTWGRGWEQLKDSTTLFSALSQTAAHRELALMATATSIRPPRPSGT